MQYDCDIADPTHNRCPYSLDLISELIDSNREHIFQHALGGGLDYSVSVDAKKNSDLGTLIDAPLINSPLIAGLRMVHGIKSRSGPVKWKMRGRVKGTNKRVDVIFTGNGPVEVRIREPVDINQARDEGTVTVKEEEATDFLRELGESYARKGKTVHFDNEISLGDEIELDISLDQISIKRAMAKIGYVATYEYLGDAYLDDSIAKEWRKAIFATTPEEVQSAQVHGLAFDATQILALMLPNLQPHEHAVAIANFPGIGLITAVTLFGTSFHNLLAVASESPIYGLAEGEGKIAICDASSRKTRFMPFADHLLQRAREMFP